MEAERHIEEMRRLGEANGGDPNSINEEVYWAGFKEAWAAGLASGLQEGRSKAMNDLNINLN